MIRSKVQKITTPVKYFLYFVINLKPNPMNIRNNIRLIGNLRLFLLLGFFLLFLAWATFNDNNSIHLIGLITGAACILLFFSRNWLIVWSLKHSRHPSLLYTVLGKMGLTGGLGLSLADRMHGKMAAPADMNDHAETDSPETDSQEYLTDQFLADNDLDTDIGPRQARLRRVLIMFVPTIGFFLYCLLSDNMYSGMEILIGGIVMIQLLVLSNMKRKARNSQALVRFMPAGLQYEGTLISWTTIDQWEYIRDAHHHGIIMIRHSDPHQIMQLTSIDLATLHTNKIDFLLLMSWFTR
jgi:hypothetical protein